MDMEHIVAVVGVVACRASVVVDDGIAARNRGIAAGHNMNIVGRGAHHGRDLIRDLMVVPAVIPHVEVVLRTVVQIVDSVARAPGIDLRPLPHRESVRPVFQDVSVRVLASPPRQRDRLAARGRGDVRAGAHTSAGTADVELETIILHRKVGSEPDEQRPRGGGDVTGART